MWGSHALKAWTGTQASIALSSGESEFCGMHSINVEGVYVKRLLEWFGFKVFWIVRSDSSAARSMAVREGVGRVRHLDSRLLYTQHLVKEEQLHIQRIAGSSNPADVGTKKHPTARFLMLRELCGVIAEPPEKEEAAEIIVAAVENGGSPLVDFLRAIGEAFLAYSKRA